MTDTPDTNPPSGQQPSGGAEEKSLIAMGDGIGRLIPADAGGLGSDSMPVLNALREYLDAERQRHRHRMIALAMGLALLLVVLLTVLLMGARGMKRTIASERTKVEKVRLQVESSLREVAKTADRLSSDVAVMTNKLVQDLAKEKQAMIQVRSELGARFEQGSNVVQDLKDAMATLEIENAALAYELRMLKSNWMAVLSFEKVSPAADTVAEKTPPESVPTSETASAEEPLPAPQPAKNPPLRLPASPVLAPSGAGESTGRVEQAAGPAQAPPASPYRGTRFRLPLPWTGKQ